MRYLRNTIKAQLGDKLSVHVSKPTRVLIMTDMQFRKYKNNLTFIYFGGHKESDYEFEIPKSGNWTVVVEKGSYYKPIDLNVKLSVDRAIAKPKLSAPKPSTEIVQDAPMQDSEE